MTKTCNYELLPAQKLFLELGDHDSDIDVALYQWHGGFGSWPLAKLLVVVF